MPWFWEGPIGLPQREDLKTTHLMQVQSSVDIPITMMLNLDLSPDNGHQHAHTAKV